MSTRGAESQDKLFKLPETTADSKDTTAPVKVDHFAPKDTTTNQWTGEAELRRREADELFFDGDKAVKLAEAYVLQRCAADLRKQLTIAAEG